MEQRTEEWFAAKLGKASASRIADVMARTKSGYAASRKNYMAELIAEILTGQTAETYISADMQRGIDEEPMARSAYEVRRNTLVEEVGFVDHPEIEQAGASPDGLVDNDGLVEIKCPKTATHIEIFLTRKIEKKYIYQMQFQLACTGRQWCDFVSYDSRLPRECNIRIIRLERDAVMIAEIELAVKEFLTERDEKLRQLRDAANAEIEIF